MTTQQLDATEQFDGIPAVRLLESLANLHQLVLVTDRDSRVVWMSDPLGVLCGGPDRHLGRDGRRLIRNLPQPNQFQDLQTEFCESGYVAHMPMEIRAADGNTLPVEISILPLASDPSRPDYFVSIARPVNGDAHSDEIPAAFLETAPDAVVAIDDRGFVSYVNAATERLVGRPRDQLLRKPIAVLLGSHAELERLVSALSPQQAIEDQDLELRCADGSTALVSLSASALPRRGSDPAGTILFLRNVARRRNEKVELERHVAELERCVQTVSHDLRSPLVALMGFSRLLRQDYGPSLDETAVHFLDRIEQAGRTMESLIHDLLELSRIGQPGDRRTMVDPRSVLLQIQAELKPRVDECGVHLALPESPAPIFCDRTRLYQVFSNLIGNAIDHMGPCDDPHVSVEVRDEDDWHHITVRDRGRGIHPEHHENIFEIFRSMPTRSERGHGTGIGLAIVKKIAETHGGRAWVESEPERGAAFHVVFARA